MEEFQRCLRDADVWDIRPRSGWFSWASGTCAKTFVCGRIDRFVAKIEWRLLFQECYVDTVSMASSDHSAILLSLEGAITNNQCRDIVHRVWENNEDSFSVKVGKIMSTLGDWLDYGPITDEFYELRRKALVDLKDVMDKDEIFWLQRSRVAWLKDGDRNSSFFHARANGSRKKNWIGRLESEGGVWCDRLEDIFGVATSYFSSLFRSSEATPDEEIFQAIDPCVSPCDNEMLCRDFAVKEITIAFSQVNPSKAPGFDGLPG
ncbi:uncharacterized protein LOC120157616 [Hibiscus syriacus]|uniref:uncharacterized protein LOC120157616 n=1 Tax=Hibiscus syriacus TaxID=106335 RepID=UPI001922F1C0|nr:uncharacterized protein LOC120157616 [Hibiscus syriacus]